MVEKHRIDRECCSIIKHVLKSVSIDLCYTLSNNK